MINLEVMRSATPHIGVGPCAGPKTIVMGFPYGILWCVRCTVYVWFGIFIKTKNTAVKGQIFFLCYFVFIINIE